MTAHKPAPQPPKTRAVGYVRVSTIEQADAGVSLEAQRHRLEAYAAFQGLDLVEVVVDAGVSGSKPLATREGGQRLIQLLHSEDGPTAILAVKLDRLFRDACDCLTMSQTWDNAGISLHFLDMGVDTRTPFGRCFITVAAGFAELERNLARERTKQGLEQVRREGGSIGRLPYGWSYAPRAAEGERCVPVPVPEEQAVIRFILRMRAEGRSLQAIADMLNNDGMGTKLDGIWRKNTISSIVKAAALRGAEGS